jgi:Protein of unknown function (DUF2892)
MRRFINALSYTFARNLGRTDRWVRALIGVLLVVPFFSGLVTAAVGIALAVLGGMILATALLARCSICYMADVCTIPLAERRSLDARKIRYERPQ